MATSPKVVVFRGWPTPKVYVASPFVTKLEARFRFSKLTYECDGGNPMKGPTGKIPYVIINDNESMGDSTLIIKHLVKTGHLPELQANLSASEKTIDLALCALLEDKLYFYNMRERWMDNYYTQRDLAFHSIPYPLRVVLGYFVHRGVKATLNGQGTGRYTATEVRVFRDGIWASFEGLLRQRRKESGKKDVTEPFWVMGGEEPTEADACLYGFIVGGMVSPAGPESTKLILGLPTVLDFANRIHEKYFKDYGKWAE